MTFKFNAILVAGLLQSECTQIYFVIYVVNFYYLTS